MRIIVLTGNQYRHKYMANELARHFSVERVFSEGKLINLNDGAVTKEYEAFSDGEKKLWDWHFGLAKQEEYNFFSNNKEFTCPLVRSVPKGQINDGVYLEEMQSINPDAIAVFGTSLLKENILEAFPGKIINMHLGLSPYYRGSGTNFWPLYNEEPEYVGVTVHLIDIGIDTGSIIHQGRPSIEKGDNQHSIGNKAIKVGVELLIQALRELSSGNMQSHKQTHKGKLYSRKDFGPKNLVKLKRLLDEGMIDAYADQPKKIKYIE